MILTTLVILAVSAQALWWLGAWWAAKKAVMLNGKGLLIDFAGITLSIVGAACSWGYIFKIGDPIPNEIVPTLMGLVTLLSILPVYGSLCLAATHIICVILRTKDNNGSGSGSATEKTEKPAKIDTRDVGSRYAILAQ